MKKVYFLSFVWAIGWIFKAVPYSEETHYMFLLSTQKVGFAFYIWALCEQIKWIMVFWIIYAETRYFRKEVRWFFWLAILKAFDYVITYNRVWDLFGVPLSVNLFALLVIGYLILKYETRFCLFFVGICYSILRDSFSKNYKSLVGKIEEATRSERSIKKLTKATG